jgi:hypothetical protein
VFFGEGFRLFAVEFNLGLRQGLLFVVGLLINSGEFLYFCNGNAEQNGVQFLLRNFQRFGSNPQTKLILLKQLN